MRNLRNTAILMATIMILSSLSGFSYHDARKNNPLNDPSIIMDVDGEEIKDLYDGYECLLEGDAFENSTDAELEESCESMMDLGYSHNQALFDFSLAAQELDIKTGRGPHIDSLVYDRVVLQTANAEYIEAHDNLRGITESIVMNANYTSRDTGDERAMKIIEDGMLSNMDICLISPPNLESLDDVNGSVSQENFTKNCESIFDDFMTPMNATYQIALEGGDWLSTLIPDDNSTPIEQLILPLAHSFAYASGSYWNCEDTNTPDRSELPTAENCDDIRPPSTVARGGEDSDGGLFNTSFHWLNVVLDVFALIVILVVLVACIVAIALELIQFFVDLFDDDPSTKPKLDTAQITKIWKTLLLFGGQIGAALKSFQKAAEDNPDVNIDPEQELFIGNAMIQGRENGWQSRDQAGDICPSYYNVLINEGDFDEEDQFLDYLWTVELVAYPGVASHSYIVNPDKWQTQVIFWQLGTYKIEVEISSSIAENIVTASIPNVIVNADCFNDDNLLDPSGKEQFDQWHSSMVIIDNECNDWKECALDDIARTMPSSEWVDKVCDDDKWTNQCYVAAITGIEHNNFFAPTYMMYEELNLRSRIGDSNVINNIDAAVVSTNDSRTIASYMNGGREIASLLVAETTYQSTLEANTGDSAALLQMKAIRKIAVDNNVHPDLEEFMDELILGWNDSTIDDNYIRAINKRITDSDFATLPEEVQTAYLTQKAVFHASEDAYSQLRIPPWVKKVLDAAEVILGVVEVYHGSFISGVSDIIHGASSLLGRAFGGGNGTHEGFTNEEICSIDTLELCVNERLEAKNYFVEERTTQPNSCGDDPALTSLTITTDQTSYSARDRIDPMYMIDCSVPTLSYVLEAQMYRQSSGIVVHATDYTWTEANTTEEFREEIEGLIVDTYCIDAVVFEKYATSATATASICFDVINKDNSADPKDDESVPGFSIMSGILALLGAAIILHRRVESE